MQTRGAETRTGVRTHVRTDLWHRLVAQAGAQLPTRTKLRYSYGAGGHTGVDPYIVMAHIVMAQTGTPASGVDFGRIGTRMAVTI